MGKPKYLDLVHASWQKLQPLATIDTGQKEAERELRLAGLSSSEKLVILKQVVEEAEQRQMQVPIVIVCESNKQARQIENMLSVNLPESVDCFFLPSLNVWGPARYQMKATESFERLHTISRLLFGHKISLTITTPLAALQYGLTKKSWHELTFTLEAGTEVDPELLCDKLQERSYIASDTVTDPGTYSLRGSVLDVFSFFYRKPLRLEFFADDLKAIRLFDPDTQLSGESLEKATFVPASEAAVIREERKDSVQKFSDYLIGLGFVSEGERQTYIKARLNGYQLPNIEMYHPVLRLKSGDLFSLRDDFFLVSWQHETIKKTYEDFIAKVEAYAADDLEHKKVVVGPEHHFSSWKRWQKQSLHLSLGGLTDGLAPWQPLVQLTTPKNKSDFFAWFVGQYREDLPITVLASSELSRQRLERLFKATDIACSSVDKLWSPLLAGHNGVKIFTGYCEDTLKIDHPKHLIIPDHALLGSKERLQGQSKKSPQSIKALLDSIRSLEPGALVIHEEHGIAKFLAMSSLEMAGQKTDFLILEFAGGDKIYVPVDKLDRVQKYSNPSEGSPKLDQLRGQSWLKRKEKAKKAVKKLAFSLLEVYAKRKMAKRPSYSSGGEIYSEFESDFPFEETGDQLRAISDVNEDLSADYPMDRLICGDVGFGKTEIALRAMVRVVVDGYQCIVMAPTTVLSFQHYSNFKDRFEKYGITVGLLNRFVPTKKANEVKNFFNQGRIDILIGTHRVLGKSIEPKNLGLIVIDEEQRFGVGQKEKLRAMRSAVDVMSLSATPIPRSLHMSVLGIKDISLLTTPPFARRPVKTYVAKWDEQLIRFAIERELERGGQLFFVHNRISDIGQVLEKLQKLVPAASMRAAHGQMPERQLESIIIDFVSGKFTVLVSTSIIETGVDIPNANTIIIHRAQYFGLAQLYQMRGRVGRSSRQGYAYLLSDGSSTAEAQQRLELLANHQDLGAGFQIASYDLDMRGAGDLLGAEQSGQVSDMGIDLYFSLLEREVKRLQGDSLSEEIEPEIKIGIDAYFPQTYITSEAQRIRLYKRLFSCRDREDLEDVENEILDRFGKMPSPARGIITIAEIKVLMKKCQIVSLVALANPGMFRLKFAGLDQAKILKIEEQTKNYSDLFKLHSDYSVTILTNTIENPGPQLLQALGRLME